MIPAVGSPLAVSISPFVSTINVPQQVFARPITGVFFSNESAVNINIQMPGQPLLPVPAFTSMSVALNGTETSFIATQTASCPKDGQFFVVFLEPSDNDLSQLQRGSNYFPAERQQLVSSVANQGTGPSIFGPLDVSDYETTVISFDGQAAAGAGGGQAYTIQMQWFDINNFVTGHVLGTVNWELSNTGINSLGTNHMAEAVSNMGPYLLVTVTPKGNGDGVTDVNPKFNMAIIARRPVTPGDPALATPDGSLLRGSTGVIAGGNTFSINPANNISFHRLCKCYLTWTASDPNFTMQVSLEDHAHNFVGNAMAISGLTHGLQGTLPFSLPAMSFTIQGHNTSAGNQTYIANIIAST